MVFGDVAACHREVCVCCVLCAVHCTFGQAIFGQKQY